MNTKRKATIFAIFAAGAYAINIPMSKIFLKYISPTIMASLLYLGAGIGIFILKCYKKYILKNIQSKSLTRKELPYTIGMVFLDIVAPILLMLGITRTNSANVSLLNNFEIVATSLIALYIFNEKISKKLWSAIALITVASIILSFEGNGSFVLNQGSFLVLGACICWGFENNCTRKISNKDSEEIVIIKGLCSGIGIILISLLLGENFPEIKWILFALILGFVSYGLSINFYVKAQKDLGAAKVSSYYAMAPFIGVVISMIILGERPSGKFYVSLLIMIISTIIMIKDSIKLQHSHKHKHFHKHLHSHGNLVHSHEHFHEHEHLHIHFESEKLHEHEHDENLFKNHDHEH